MAVAWTPELLMGQLLEDLEETEQDDDMASIAFKAHCLARDTAILLQQELASIRRGEPVTKKKGPLHKLSKMAGQAVKIATGGGSSEKKTSPPHKQHSQHVDETHAAAHPKHRASTVATPHQHPTPSPKPAPKARSKSVVSSSAGIVKPRKSVGDMGKKLLTSAMPGKSAHKLSSGNSQPKHGNKLKVLVRKRPPKVTEEDKVECRGNQVFLYENMVKVDLTKYVKTHKFCYDDAFGEDESTADLYHSQIQELVDNFFDRGTSTCFCFGQTASGKTFTLFGAGGGQVMSEEEMNQDSYESGGVYMLAAEDIFQRLESDSSVCLSVSMFEIYGQKVRDLLDDGNELAALEDGDGVLQLVGLTMSECLNMEDFNNVSNIGRLARSTTATGANATSSRSHAAMLFRLVSSEPNPNPDQPKKVLGKFSLIDLAGSERGKDNEATDKKTQMEGRQINTSLLALKEVIRAKELGRKHAPYRQSRLTQVLEESLTGDRCHTTVIGCVSPSAPDSQQTLNTLRYAESLAGKKRAPRESTRREGGNSVSSNPLTTTRNGQEEEEDEDMHALSSKSNVKKPAAASSTVASRRVSAPALQPQHAASHGMQRRSMPPQPSSGLSRSGLFPKVEEEDDLYALPSAPEKKKSTPNTTSSISTASSRLSAISALKDEFGDSDDELNLMEEFNDDELNSISELDDILEEVGLEEYHDTLSSAMNDGNTLAELKELGLDGAIKAGVPKIKAMKLWRAVMMA